MLAPSSLALIFFHVCNWVNGSIVVFPGQERPSDHRAVIDYRKQSSRHRLQTSSMVPSESDVQEFLSITSSYDRSAAHSYLSVSHFKASHIGTTNHADTRSTMMTLAAPSSPGLTLVKTPIAMPYVSPRRGLIQSLMGSRMPGRLTGRSKALSSGHRIGALRIKWMNYLVRKTLCARLKMHQADRCQQHPMPCIR